MISLNLGSFGMRYRFNGNSLRYTSRGSSSAALFTAKIASSCCPMILRYSAYRNWVITAFGLICIAFWKASSAAIQFHSYLLYMSPNKPKAPDNRVLTKNVFYFEDLLYWQLENIIFFNLKNCWSLFYVCCIYH